MALTSEISTNDNRQNSSHDKFSHVTLCDSCTHKSCCTDFAEPILFPTDIEKLASIKKSGSDFILDEKIKDIHVKTIRRRANSKSCIFLNEEQNFCSIYENRPFDCRMFPFDIAWVKNEYHWIIYTCNPNSDWSWTEEHLQKLEEDSQFSEVMREIEVFRLVSKNFISMKAHVVLRKVGGWDGRIP